MIQFYSGFIRRTSETGRGNLENCFSTAADEKRRKFGARFPFQICTGLFGSRVNFHLPLALSVAGSCWSVGQVHRVVRNQGEPFTHYFHLILQPMLGFCPGSIGFPDSSASSAPRRSLPLTGTSLPGRESSS